MKTRAEYIELPPETLPLYARLEKRTAEILSNDQEGLTEDMRTILACETLLHEIIAAQKTRKGK